MLVKSDEIWQKSQESLSLFYVRYAKLANYVPKKREACSLSNDARQKLWYLHGAGKIFFLLDFEPTISAVRLNYLKNLQKTPQVLKSDLLYRKQIIIL